MNYTYYGTSHCTYKFSHVYAMGAQSNRLHYMSYKELSYGFLHVRGDNQQVKAGGLYHVQGQSE